jgi:hypothetical protein
MRLLGQSPSPGPFSCPYSPECVEGKFCEVRLTSISLKYQGGAVFGLQPALLLFIIFSIKVIEKMIKNVRDLLRQEYTTERRSGAKVAL